MSTISPLTTGVATSVFSWLSFVRMLTLHLISGLKNLWNPDPGVSKITLSCFKKLVKIPTLSPLLPASASLNLSSSNLSTLYCLDESIPLTGVVS